MLPAWWLQPLCVFLFPFLRSLYKNTALLKIKKSDLFCYIYNDFKKALIYHPLYWLFATFWLYFLQIHRIFAIHFCTPFLLLCAFFRYNGVRTNQREAIVLISFDRSMQKKKLKNIIRSRHFSSCFFILALLSTILFFVYTLLNIRQNSLQLK